MGERGIEKDQIEKDLIDEFKAERDDIIAEGRGMITKGEGILPEGVTLWHRNLWAVHFRTSAVLRLLFNLFTCTFPQKAACIPY